jgi:predicted  nucleic acid-binding Zn-ribbon protein
MSGEERQAIVDFMDDVLKRLDSLVGPLKEDISAIKRDIERLDEIESEMFAIKAVLKETNRDIRGFDKKVSSLEEKIQDTKQDLGNTHAMAYDALSAAKLRSKQISSLNP